MKTLVMDLDGTLTIDGSADRYEDMAPRLEIVEKVRDYAQQGFKIVIYSARNMRTFEGRVGRINAVTVPIIVDWLNKHDIPFDEIHVGKPWCGHEGFYVDDKAIRPSEFAKLSLKEIDDLIAREAVR